MNKREEIIISKNLKLSRKVTFYFQKNKSCEKLCLFLDAEFYLEKMNTIKILENLITKGLIPNMAFLFVSNQDAERRHFDYTCSEEYANYIVNDVFLWCKNILPSITEKQHMICGLSLSALQSAFTMLNHGNRFPYCLAQSGSFWWNEEWLSKNIPENSKGKIWVSVGNKETSFNINHAPTSLYQGVSQIVGVQNFVSKLKENRLTVHYEIYEGGHELPPWEKELSRALIWLNSTS